MDAAWRSADAPYTGSMILMCDDQEDLARACSDHAGSPGWAALSHSLVRCDWAVIGPARARPEPWPTTGAPPGDRERDLLRNRTEYASRCLPRGFPAVAEALRRFAAYAMIVRHILSQAASTPARDGAGRARRRGPMIPISRARFRQRRRSERPTPCRPDLYGQPASLTWHSPNLRPTRTRVGGQGVTGATRPPDARS